MRCYVESIDLLNAFTVSHIERDCTYDEYEFMLSHTVA